MQADELGRILPEVLPGAVQTFVVGEVCADGSTWTETNWTLDGKQVARLVMSVFPDRAHYEVLQVEAAFQQQGIYAAIKQTHESWLRKRGIGAMSCFPGDAKAEAILATQGFHWFDWAGAHYFGTAL